jgi:hypothetical protein
MKKMIIALFAFLTMTVSASAMSYEQARNEALFLTDKMAYELNLTDLQYEAAYEINLDYLMSVTDYNDVLGLYWERRNQDIRYILYSWQWDLFRAATYFYRPLIWDGGYWHFGIYARYPRRDYFYFGRPHFYASYRGGHSWRMNGGRSYYEGRRDHFRPGHVERGSHFGMRSGWDRGDYRGQHGTSSTRITGPGRRDNGNYRHDNGNYRHDNGNYRHDNGNYRHDNEGYRNEGRGGNSSSGHFEGSRSGNRTFDGSRSGNRTFDGSRSGNRSFGGSRNSDSRSAGSYSGSHSSGSYNNSHSSGSFGGSSNRGSGSFSGSRSSHSSGSFSGGHSGGGHSSGSFSGGHGGGSRGGGATRGGGDSSRGSSRR